MRVTSCGVPLVTDEPVTLVLVSAVKVHVPPLTEIVVDGSDPVDPDLFKSIWVVCVEYPYETLAVDGVATAEAIA